MAAIKPEVIIYFRQHKLEYLLCLKEIKINIQCNSIHSLKWWFCKCRQSCSYRLKRLKIMFSLEHSGGKEPPSKMKYQFPQTGQKRKVMLNSLNKLSELQTRTHTSTLIWVKRTTVSSEKQMQSYNSMYVVFQGHMVIKFLNDNNLAV